MTVHPPIAGEDVVGDACAEVTRSTDILVVGAGPVGLFGAYYAGFRGLRVTVIDSLPEPGGQVGALYPDKQILDVAGHPSISGRDLVAALVAQAEPFAPAYLLGDSAAQLSRTACDGRPAWRLRTRAGHVIDARAVVIAGGIGTFNPRRLPAAEGWHGGGVEYLVRDPGRYRGRRAVLVGGGDTAVDWALALSDHAAAVTLVHRTSRFRAHAASLAELARRGVEVITDATVVRIDGGATVESVTVRTAAGQRRLACDVVVPALGYLADLRCFRAWGLAMSDHRIEVDSLMRTSLPRVYAAGDIVDYPGKVRLIAVGFGEVATAVNHAAHAINPNLSVFPGHSTDVPPPGVAGRPET